MAIMMRGHSYYDYGHSSNTQVVLQMMMILTVMFFWHLLDDANNVTEHWTSFQRRGERLKRWTKFKKLTRWPLKKNICPLDKMCGYSLAHTAFKMDQQINWHQILFFDLSRTIKQMHCNFKVPRRRRRSQFRARWRGIITCPSPSFLLGPKLFQLPFACHKKSYQLKSVLRNSVYSVW